MKWLRWLKETFHNSSVRKKIFTGSLLIAIVPMVIGYLLMLHVFNLTFRDNLQEEADVLMTSSTEAVVKGFSDIYDAVGQLSRNATVKEGLEQDDSDSDAKVYRELYSVTGKYGKYANYAIYDAEGNLETSIVKNRYIKEKLPLDWGVLYEVGAGSADHVTRNARIYDGTQREEYLRVAAAVRDDQGNITGYIVAAILKEHFADMLTGIGKEKQGILYLIDDFQETVYCSEKKYDEDELRSMRKLLEESGESELTGIDYTCYMTYIEDCNLYLYYRQPTAAMNLMRHSIFIIALFSSLLTLLLCLILSKYFSSYFYRPIQKMQGALREIQEGHFDAHIEVEDTDEFGQLSDSFNVMSEHLTDNMEKLLLRERDLNEANIKMMQAQLNPHFLYNTLDTMKWLGKANDVPEVATLSSGMAQILRMSISAGQFITLAEEMNLLEAYVEIQKIRFEDKFEFIVDLPDGLTDCEVPKLILQPLVENSIIHGFDGREKGIIIVQAVQEDGELLITVQDDGIGINDEMLCKLNENIKLESNDHGNIGFYNVNAIIKLNYGETYGMHVTLREEGGTIISVKIPIRRA